MGNYRYTINPHTGKLQKVLSDSYITSIATCITFKPGVDTVGDLPSTGNVVNDGRFANDTHHLYIWDGASWQDQGDIFDITWGALEDKPTSTVGDIDDAVTKKHDKLHSIDDVTNHTGISGSGIEDNFMAIDANGLPKDSEKGASDFANSIHTHLEGDITDLDHDALKINGIPVDAPATGEDGEVLTYNESLNKYELQPAGAGDMLKSVYDIGDNGIVDNSEKLEGSTKAQVQNHAPQAHTHNEIDILDLDHYDSADFATDFGSADLVNLAGKSYNDLTDKPDLSDLHSHGNKSELDLVTDGDHDVREDNPHNISSDQVSFTETGFSATNIHDAITELDSEKAPNAHTHVETDITDLDHYDSTDFDTDFATKNINDLADVLFDTGTPADNDVLTYDLASGKWKAEASIAGATTLPELTDVVFDTGTPTDGQVLTYDSGTSKWKAETPSAGAGDMLKSVYDTNDNGVVDDTEKVNTANVDAPASGATDDGRVLVYDSATNTLKYERRGIEHSSYIEDETESTTTDDTNWQPKLSLPFTALKVGNYIVEWSVEMANSGANKGTYIRVIMDNITGGSATELNCSLNAPIVANGWLTSSGFKRITLADLNAHYFDIDFRAETSTSTAKVRRVRIAIRKVA